MRVRRFLFAVRSKGSCPWACQSFGAQGCAKDARHGGNPWQLFANRPTAGHAWHRRNAAWRLARAWWGLVGLGYFATLSGLIGLAGKYFAQFFSGLRGRMPAVGALAKSCGMGAYSAPPLPNTTGHAMPEQYRSGQWQRPVANDTFCLSRYLAPNPCHKLASVAGVQNHAGGAHGSNTSACKNGCGEMTTKKGEPEGSPFDKLGQSTLRRSTRSSGSRSRDRVPDRYDRSCGCYPTRSGTCQARWRCRQRPT